MAASAKSIATLFFTRPVDKPSTVYVMLGLPWQFRMDGAASHATWELPVISQRDARVLSQSTSVYGGGGGGGSGHHQRALPRPRDVAVRLGVEYTLNNLGGRRVYEDAIVGSVQLTGLGVRCYAFELKPSQAVSLEGLGRSLQRMRRNALQRPTPMHPYEDWRWYDLETLTDITPHDFSAVATTSRSISKAEQAQTILHTQAGSPSKTARNVASQTWLILRHVVMHKRFHAIFQRPMLPGAVTSAKHASHSDNPSQDDLDSRTNDSKTSALSSKTSCMLHTNGSDNMKRPRPRRSIVRKRQRVVGEEDSKHPSEDEWN